MKKLAIISLAILSILFVFGCTQQSPSNSLTDTNKPVVVDFESLLAKGANNNNYLIEQKIIVPMYSDVNIISIVKTSRLGSYASTDTISSQIRTGQQAVYGDETLFIDKNDGKNTYCTKKYSSDQWYCMVQSAIPFAGKYTAQDIQKKFLVDYELKKTSEEMILGEKAYCFDFNKNTESFYVCYTYDGLIVKQISVTQVGSEYLEATSIRRNLTESDFDAPESVEDPIGVQYDIESYPKVISDALADSHYTQQDSSLPTDAKFINYFNNGLGMTLKKGDSLDNSVGLPDKIFFDGGDFNDVLVVQTNSATENSQFNYSQDKSLLIRVHLLCASNGDYLDQGLAIKNETLSSGVTAKEFCAIPKQNSTRCCVIIFRK